ncbi:hypothetical protein ACFYNO_17355 [Kitasatospora sp. NPDC006697]|uniref:hypothetical protein n=1 Tax=Kitasatospora sp. NPDC006697 TaxID=3364020 RepID=UPI0036A3A32F
MNAIVTSLIAVLGTLLGSTVTHVFQQRSAQRSERSSREERLRQERLDACGRYAGLLVEFRQAMLHHWFCLHEGEDEEDEIAIRRRTFELRSATQHALFRLHLVVGEPELVTTATEAFTVIGKMDRAPDRRDIVARRDATRDLVDAFVATARRHV